jgi:hypoxanthine phosphoribosyltransferase
MPAAGHHNLSHTIDRSLFGRTLHCRLTSSPETPMYADIEKILYTAEDIKARVEELGAVITRDYQGKSILLLGILQGAVRFLNDLRRAIRVPLQCEVMALSSYGDRTESRGAADILRDTALDIKDRDVLIVEDIVDTGITLQRVLEHLATRRPATLRVCALLDKPSRRRVTINPDYCGFIVPDVFVVGYGLDYAQNFRELPYIGVLKGERREAKEKGTKAAGTPRCARGRHRGT